MNLDQDRILKHSDQVWSFITTLSHPRFVGSEGHTKAKNLILERFNSLASIHNSEIQSFPAYLASFKKPKIILQMMSISILVIPLSFLAHLPLMGLIFSLISFFLSIALIMVRKNRMKTLARDPSTIQGQNLLFHHHANSKEQNQKPNLIILAHYDSIVRSYSVVPNALLFIFGNIGGYIYLLQSLFYSINSLSSPEFGTNHSPASLSWGLLVALAVFLFTLDKLHNSSPGVLDNASGVAAMYQLALNRIEVPLQNVNLIFIATDAEELGNLGGSAFFKQNREYCGKDNYFLVIDTIGVQSTNRIVTGSILPHKDFSQELEHLAKGILQNKETPSNIRDVLKIFRFPPLFAVSSDHNTVLHENLPFLLLGGVDSVLHTPKDDLSRLDREKFFNILTFLELFVREFDAQYSTTNQSN